MSEDFSLTPPTPPRNARDDLSSPPEVKRSRLDFDHEFDLDPNLSSIIGHEDDQGQQRSNDNWSNLTSTFVAGSFISAGAPGPRENDLEVDPRGHIGSGDLSRIAKGQIPLFDTTCTIVSSIFAKKTVIFIPI